MRVTWSVVEAESKQAIAQHILDHPQQWESYLNRSYPSDWQDPTFNVGSLWECAQNSEMTPERLLELIDMTSVDGDSTSQREHF